MFKKRYFYLLLLIGYLSSMHAMDSELPRDNVEFIRPSAQAAIINSDQLDDLEMDGIKDKIEQYLHIEGNFQQAMSDITGNNEVLLNENHYNLMLKALMGIIAEQSEIKEHKSSAPTLRLISNEDAKQLLETAPESLKNIKKILVRKSAGHLYANDALPKLILFEGPPGVEKQN